MSFKFNLGSEVKDKVTGYKGIVRARTEYLTGCNTYGCQSTKMKDNKPDEWVWFDEGGLTLVKDKKVSFLDEAMPSTKGGALNSNQLAPKR
jgi:hypothetical protein